MMRPVWVLCLLRAAWASALGLSSEWSYEGATLTLAHLNFTFSDPHTGELCSRAGEIGRFGMGAVGTASGILAVPSRLNGTGSAYGCSWPEAVPKKPWLALVSGGSCSDAEKARVAFGLNASALIVYQGEDDSSASRMSPGSFAGTAGVVVFIGRGQGEKLVQLVQGGTEVFVRIRRGQEVKFRIPNINRTSILFVSVSFIVLMIISLAWLVFYYIQRFRYINAKVKLARHLCTAAKKALAKIPVHTVKSGDKEVSLESECCAVCIEPYQVSDTVRILPCKHVFHKSCVDPWLLDHRTCPMCKMDILKHYGLTISNNPSNILVHIQEDEQPNIVQLRVPNNPSESRISAQQLNIPIPTISGSLASNPADSPQVVSGSLGNTLPPLDYPSSSVLKTVVESTKVRMSLAEPKTVAPSAGQIETLQPPLSSPPCVNEKTTSSVEGPDRDVVNLGLCDSEDEFDVDLSDILEELDSSGNEKTTTLSSSKFEEFEDDDEPPPQTDNSQCYLSGLDDNPSSSGERHLSLLSSYDKACSSRRAKTASVLLPTNNRISPTSGSARETIYQAAPSSSGSSGQIRTGFMSPEGDLFPEQSLAASEDGTGSGHIRRYRAMRVSHV